MYYFGSAQYRSLDHQSLILVHANARDHSATRACVAALLKSVAALFKKTSVADLPVELVLILVRVFPYNVLQHGVPDGATRTSNY